MNFGSWNMSNIKNESEVITIALYSEKIADNDRKIEQLSKNIKRDTEKRKKLMEENARLSYQAICEQWGCTGQDLLDILSTEHQQAEMLQTSGLSDADIAELAGSSRSSELSGDLRTVGLHGAGLARYSQQRTSAGRDAPDKRSERCRYC